MKTRLCAALLAACLALSLLPGGALAVSLPEETMGDLEKTVEKGAASLTSEGGDVLDTAGGQPIPEAGNVEEEMDCHEMTELWFGESETAALFDADETGPVSTIEAYFKGREADLLPSRARRSAAASKESRERRSAVAELEARTGIRITDAEVTVQPDMDSVSYYEGAPITLYVFEWTFFDYDDLADGEGGSDTSGYGTWHKLTMEEQDGACAVIGDEYDESDLLGLSTLSEETREEMESLGYLPGGAQEEVVSQTESVSPEEGGTLYATSLQSAALYSGYNPDAAAAYADRYALSYNSAYADFNSVGGDCANFVSQSISAGGMPQVTGSNYGRDGWFYRSASNRSGTWTMASYLCDWMANNRGTLAVATRDNVYKGSPCFYNNKGHATICVGKNSAGTPIINSHNNDRYHVAWNYWTVTSIYTVQLTGGSSGTPSLQVAEYFDCDVQIDCYQGQTVNLYNSPLDSSRVTYFSGGQPVTAYSTHGARLSDGSVWYQIQAMNSGQVRTFWLKRDDSKMSITNANPELNISISSVSMDPGDTRTIYIQFGKGDFHHLFYELDKADVISAAFENLNLDAGTAELKLTGKDPGSVNVVLSGRDENDRVLISRSVQMTVRSPEVSFSPGTLTLSPEEQSSVAIRFRNVPRLRKIHLECEGDNVASGTWGDTDWSEGTTSLRFTAKTPGAMRCKLQYIDGDGKTFFTSETFTVTVSTPTYTVFYDANGGNSAPARQTKTYGQALALSRTEPKRESYTFRGWTLLRREDDWNGSPDYYPGAAYTVDKAATLYALWAHESYTVTYAMNDGSGKDWGTAQIKYYGKPLTLHANAPSREGWRFMGWATTPGGEAEYQSGDTYTREGRTTLYAVWAPPVSSATIAVQGQTASPGGTTAVRLVLRENPGVISMRLRVDYDHSALILTKVEDGKILGEKNHGNDLNTSPYVLSWANDTATENFAADGIAATLVFTVSPQTKAGIYPVKVSYEPAKDDILDKDLNRVEFAVENGAVTVSNVLVGDVNRDGGVTSVDRIFLTRYLADWKDYTEENVDLAAADVNQDGAVTSVDRVILSRHLAGWSGYETLPYKAGGLGFIIGGVLPGGELVGAGSSLAWPAALRTECGNVGSDGIVEVRVYLENNPGLASARLNVDYDHSVLTLIGVEDGGILGQAQHSDDFSASPYVLSWANDTAMENFTANGTVATLRFSVREDELTGDYPIALSYDSGVDGIINKDLQPVSFRVSNGAVRVERDTGFGVSIKTAEKTDSGLRIAVDGNPGPGAHLVSSFYDENECFLGLCVQDAVLSGNYQETLDIPRAGLVKIMLVDSSWRPLCPAWKLRL